MPKEDDGKLRKLTRGMKRGVLKHVEFYATGYIWKRPVVVAIVEGRDVYSQEEFVGVGWAKVCGTDHWDVEKGKNIARGKAIHHVCEQYADVAGADRYGIDLGMLFDGYRIAPESLEATDNSEQTEEKEGIPF